MHHVGVVWQLSVHKPLMLRFTSMMPGEGRDLHRTFLVLRDELSKGEHDLSETEEETNTNKIPNTEMI